jgi:hypothetical protein|tara:strand:- start:29 stop:379 length:351 start_codon:yes stop_codon:yes gene_type:complete
MPVIKRKRKKHLRNLERNKSGRSATVKMEFYPDEPKIDGRGKRHYVAPSITFKGNEPARKQSFNQALEAGEVYEFMNKKKAEKFSKYSWKEGEARKEAKKVYREAKKTKRKKKKIM